MSGSDLQKAWATGYLSGGSMAYVDGLYEDFLADPMRVEPEWREIFQALATKSAQGDVSHRDVVEYFLHASTAPRAANRSQTMGTDETPSRVLDLIRAYRMHGHLAAQLDPLMPNERSVPDLSLAFHQLNDVDASRMFSLPSTFASNPLPLPDIEAKLRQTYCGHIGVEVMHCSSDHEITWFYEKIEAAGANSNFDAKKKRAILNELIAADGLERYLATRYVGQKRFSLEGGDAFVPLMKEVIRHAADFEVKELVIGMAHRGRLNVLVNVLGKEPAILFQEFEGKIKHDRTGDVKYHLGFSSDLRTESGRDIHVALAFNPSHLEIIGPVVEGSARSRLHKRGDLVDKNSVIPVVVHGDAAFAGQGVNMEAFNFSQSPGYCTGGTVHVVINNQIGFTTSNPADARSSLYCTDIAKMVQAPVLHVNGEDPEAVVFAAQMAIEFRMKFKRDVVIDMFCYRRNGHNEADEPSVTQPMMYKRIKTMRPLRESYAEKLMAEGVVSLEDSQQAIATYRDQLDAGRGMVETVLDHYPGKQVIDWSIYWSAHWDDAVKTCISSAVLHELSERLQTLPEGFELHSVVKRLLHDRELMSTDQIPLNWGYAETLAYATLLHEGYGVRLSGQDCARGTFAHRHAVLHDQANGAIYTPLNHVATNPLQGFTVVDSVLSEEAVLAFEYGYASSEPSSLVLWEAQFGDFANGAQVVIDQFISSGEQKWGRLCGLVMLLPHGYEGQGPEHSSARLERYLQLCAQENMQVCTPTTPAQIFHLLRRQVHRAFRKPLIVMTPKSLLRHKLATSTCQDLTEGQFQVVIPEVDGLDVAKVRRVVLCCGKVYYDLLQARRDGDHKHVALIRLEQLYPFPKDALNTVLAPFSHVEQFIWCQEEPENQGVWLSLQHDMRACLQGAQTLVYAGRPPSASPAVGSAALHAQQQHDLVEQALLK